MLGDTLRLFALVSFKTKLNFIGDCSSFSRIIWRDHGIIGRQVPLGSVLIGRHAKGDHHMILEQFELFTVFKANDIIRLHRGTDCYGRFLFGGFGRSLIPKSCQCAMSDTATLWLLTWAATISAVCIMSGLSICGTQFFPCMANQLYQPRIIFK